MEYSMLKHSVLPIKHWQLIKFLELNDWKIAHTLQNGALLYKNDEGKEFLIPTDDSYADYDKLIYSALSELSLLHATRIDILLGKIAFPDSDAFKFSLKSSSTKYGLIPLNFLVDYTESLKTWLLSGAAFVLNPKRFHSKLSTKETEDWLKRCRMGQSEFGSYVLNIVFPLEAEKQKRGTPQNSDRCDSYTRPKGESYDKEKKSRTSV